jgi:hypothetical protein
MKMLYKLARQIGGKKGGSEHCWGIRDNVGVFSIDELVVM